MADNGSESLFVFWTWDRGSPVALHPEAMTVRLFLVDHNDLAAGNGREPTGIILHVCTGTRRALP